GDRGDEPGADPDAGGRLGPRPGEPDAPARAQAARLIPPQIRGRGASARAAVLRREGAMAIFTGGLATGIDSNLIVERLVQMRSAAIDPPAVRPRAIGARSAPSGE